MAAAIGRTGITPNSISVISMFFAVTGAACFLYVSKSPCQWAATLCWFGAALSIQLRLLCNLLDGMVAIENGKKSATGGLYNEVPDRVADALFLAAAGYSATTLSSYTVPLGWQVTTLAMVTAYIRVLGGTLVGTQSFIGPMAKQHRMALLTLTCLLSILEVWVRKDGNTGEYVLFGAFIIMAVGTAWTCVRRLNLISADLRAGVKPQSQD